MIDATQSPDEVKNLNKFCKKILIDNISLYILKGDFNG